MKKTILVFSVLLVNYSCKKTESGCKGGTQNSFGFETFEYVLDTMLKTDTAFTNRNVSFKANSPYSNIKWKIGNDDRDFINNQSVILSFNSPEEINATLKANAKNNNCIEVQNEITKKIVLVNDNGSVLSPLIGSYIGYNVDNPNDTFTVAIKFWFGARYNWWAQGAYSIENLPKGFTDSTQNFNGYNRPEIRGIISSTGYKNIAIEKTGNVPALGIKGYGSIKRGSRDTLIFNYTIIDTLKLNHTGELYYIARKFIGIKK